ncbi:MAG: hypothetical protein R3D52_00605 [Xanthobacteraceae bacterium]
MLVTAIFRFASALLAAIGVLAFVATAGAATNPEAGFQTSAPYAILIDAETGTVLFEKAADEPTPPSSLAKLMTAEIIFKQITEGKLTRDTEMIISEHAWRHGGAPRTPRACSRRSTVVCGSRTSCVG